MNKTLFAAMATIVAFGVATPAIAADPELCLECHVPAEDWEGLSADDILEQAKDQGNRRHKDHADLTDEQLNKMITKAAEAEAE